MNSFENSPITPLTPSYFFPFDPFSTSFSPKSGELTKPCFSPSPTLTINPEFTWLIENSEELQSSEIRESEEVKVKREPFFTDYDFIFEESVILKDEFNFNQQDRETRTPSKDQTHSITSDEKKKRRLINNRVSAKRSRDEKLALKISLLEEQDQLKQLISRVAQTIFYHPMPLNSETIITPNTQYDLEDPEALQNLHECTYLQTVVTHLMDISTFFQTGIFLNLNPLYQESPFQMPEAPERNLKKKKVEEPVDLTLLEKPIDKLTHEEKLEARKIRNRISAKASREKVRTLIETLLWKQQELDQLVIKLDNQYQTYLKNVKTKGGLAPLGKRGINQSSHKKKLEYIEKMIFTLLLDTLS